MLYVSHRVRQQMQLAALFVAAVDVDHVLSRGVVLPQVHRIRPSSVRLLFGGIPDNVILTIGHAPCGQIHLIAAGYIRRDEPHGAAVRRNLGCDPRRQFFHIGRRAGDQLLFAISLSIDMDHVIPSGIMI